MGWAAAGALAAGALGFGGGLLQNRASAKEAKKQRKWAEHMYRHRYRYTMEDLEAAGLNPAFAGALGGGSVPSGASATQVNPLQQAATSAKALAIDRQQLKNMEAGEKKDDKQADLFKSQDIESEERAENIRKERELIDANIQATRAGAKRTDVERQLQETLMPSAKSMRDLDQTDLGELLRKLKRVRDSIFGSSGGYR